jgi:hypothetical protein
MMVMTGIESIVFAPEQWAGLGEITVLGVDSIGIVIQERALGYCFEVSYPS